MKNKFAAVIFFIIVIALVCVALLSGTVGKGSGKVVFTDSSDSEIATVRLDGEKEIIDADEEGYTDYIKISLEEALKLYGESKKTDNENIKADFFENTVTVKTNFDRSYYEKIKEAVSSSELEEDTPFASVIVDRQGRVLASYSFVTENEKTYSLNKTYVGSAIKPISVYAPAIDNKSVHWSTQIKDAPIKKIMSESEGVKEWPSNASGTYTNENMLLCDALYKSINTVAVRVLKRIGVGYAVDFLSERLSFNLEGEKKILKNADEDEIYGNIALGYLIDGASPLDMAGYYQMFINGGKYTEPSAVISCEDKDGNIIKNINKTRKVISTETASLMTRLLEGVVQEGGTGKDAAVDGVSVAGKSGTSDNYYDNWFIGFTPEFVCSVWHGYNDEQKNSASSVFGGIMKLFPETGSSFKLSKGVVAAFYCNKSGGLKGEKCYDTSVGYYLKDSMPSVCKECGK